MGTHVLSAEHEIAPAARTASRIGCPAAVLLALLAAVGFLIGIATPPRSGPFCSIGCIAYPFAEADLFYPRDYFWMIPGVLLTPMFVLMAGCLHFCVPPRAKPLTLLAFGFATIGMAIVTLDYFLQILAVVPSLAHHEAEGVAFFTQYNPHGAFLAMEDLGYLLLAAAMLFAGAAVPRNIRPGHSLRWLLLLAGGLSLVTFTAMAVAFGSEMALPSEIAIILIQWPALIAIGILQAIFFWHAGGRFPD
jgi:hypothetical protein